MRYTFNCWTSVLPILFSYHTLAAEPLPYEEVGKDYAVARVTLIKQGYVPVDQMNNTSRACMGDEEACSRYSEISSCFVDQPLCRSDWRVKNECSFYIISRVEANGKLVVVGLNKD